jgi:hypothetical protein
MKITMRIRFFYLLILSILPMQIIAQSVEYPLDSNWKARRAADIPADGTVNLKWMDGWKPSFQEPF